MIPTFLLVWAYVGLLAAYAVSHILPFRRLILSDYHVNIQYLYIDSIPAFSSLFIFIAHNLLRV
jgi:hypothetical protein